MEYRLNKIDMDIRRDINDETKEGKVHSKKDIQVSKENNDQKQRKQEAYKGKNKEEFDLAKYANVNKKITIDAIKMEDVEVQAVKEEQSGSQNENRGLFIDVRK